MELNGQTVPRVFNGLWQLSSPAWGSAPKSKMKKHFKQLLENKFWAFDMADHYGDAELIFSELRQTSSHTFCATKWCVFDNEFEVSPENVKKEIDTRIRRTGGVDLLQFYWQNKDAEKPMLEICKLIVEDKRCKLGLCNFDTLLMKKVVESGIKVYTNQVQFSLIDIRPRLKMGKFCDENDIKLLAYGTLCGGLLSDKWLGKEEPDIYGDDSITPSQRKYFDMIENWGGWDLFQELLAALKKISAKRDDLSISIVAARWVLKHSFVGSIIIGTRLGVKDHSLENIIIDDYTWDISTEEMGCIDSILEKSRASHLIELLGDCGDEYR
ncbi:uncharacterized protein OGAPODRAFT_75760 [Ogataea polymorpha]|uniref:uncharacterized protein n=1 Tax=Ogataea polymorpha TaxID=460523 RepID=UPI0007F4A56C|nr:uncharacterized protein OGAPODRAFT_75760 [Ogataea polymorpha]KAG7935466.1 hypothetical protein KL934_002025 [Ogataea polymorpha]OBA17932.1 hypothetical protein OGAPODRAFT_75760 [Ogataea polymorpha]